MRITTIGMQDLKSDLNKYNEKFNDKNIKQLNMIRAKIFRKFFIKSLRQGTLNLRPIDDKSHNPMYDSGKLARECKVRTIDKNVRVGYFDDNNKKPPNSKFTYTELVRIHAAGYRVGKRRVYPRPIIEKALREYNKTGMDEKIIFEFIKNNEVKFRHLSKILLTN